MPLNTAYGGEKKDLGDPELLVVAGDFRRGEAG